MIKKLFLIVIFLIVSCDLNKNIIGLSSRFGLGCDVEDKTPPTNIGALEQLRIAAVTRSPEYKWQTSVDFCGMDKYEMAIGTTPGGEELLPFYDIGKTPQYRATGLTLDPTSTYYTSVRAVDANGNYSEVATAGPWMQLDPVNDLPNLIVRLDSNALSSIIDSSGVSASSGSFNGDVQNWNDTSSGGSVHNFFSVSNVSRPTYNLAGYFEFNGVDQAFTVLDHEELNIRTVDQRNFSAVFQTGTDITTRQIIYDEGGTVRGMNYYIDNGQFYCGFYNTVEADGDGVQDFTYVNTPIAVNTKYVATWVFDYSNFDGPDGPDARLDCYVNGELIGSTTSTSRLFAHSGDIGLGGRVQDSHFTDGPFPGNGNYFNGRIFEFMIINGIPGASDLDVIYEYLSDKWSVP